MIGGTAWKNGHLGIPKWPFSNKAYTAVAISVIIALREFFSKVA